MSNHGTLTTKNKLSTLLAALVTAVLAATLAFAGPAAPAKASAYGVNGWGQLISYDGKYVYKGVYHAYISGTRTYVEYVKGWPQMTTPISGNLCNWNITAEFFDTSGRWYRTYTGPTHLTCNSYGKVASADYLYIRQYMKPGRMCSTLKSNGARLTSVCHSIY